MRGATRPCFRPRWRRPVGSRLVFGSSLLPSRVAPQLIGLISGVITGVTAGADIGFIGAADIIGFERFAALRTGFFRAAFLAGLFLEAFLEDFFFEPFFFEAFFLATRFLEDFLEDFFEDFFEDFLDFFLAFFAPAFFFEAFFFVAMVKLLFNVGPIVCRALLRVEVCRTTNFSIRIERDW